MFDKSAHRRIDRLEEADSRLLEHVGDVNRRLDEYVREGFVETNRVALSMAIEQTSVVDEQLAAAALYAEFLRGECYLLEGNR